VKFSCDHFFHWECFRQNIWRNEEAKDFMFKALLCPICVKPISVPQYIDFWHLGMLRGIKNELLKCYSEKAQMEVVDEQESLRLINETWKVDIC